MRLDRRPRRHGLGSLRALGPIAPRPAHKPFKAHAPGHRPADVNDLPQMAEEDRRRDLFVATDRPTRWVFGRLCTARTAANARLRVTTRRGPCALDA